MLKHRMVALLAVAAMVGGAGIASANSIGINFTANNGQLDTLTAAQTAGVVSQANWNNIAYVRGSFSGSGSGLVDNTGAATSTSMAFVGRSENYDISSTTGIAPDASNGDQIMMNGGTYGNNGTFPNSINNTTAGGDASGASTVATVSNIPYSVYNVYVYGLVDHGGTTEGLAIGNGAGANPATSTGDAPFNATSTVYELTPTPSATGYVDGTSPSGFIYTPATSTNSAAPTAGADYAEFTGVTGTSFSVGAIYVNNASPAIEGIQIVDASNAIPEPATLALAGVGAAGLLLRRKRKLA